MPAYFVTIWHANISNPMHLRVEARDMTDAIKEIASLPIAGMNHVLIVKVADDPVEPR